MPYVKVAAFSRGSAGDDEVAHVLDAAHAAGVQLVTVTQGVRGATGVPIKGEVLFAPAVSVEAVDTLGAGDAFIGRLACRVLASVPLAEAARDAAQYSALICQNSRRLWAPARHHPRNSILRTAMTDSPATSTLSFPSEADYANRVARACAAMKQDGIDVLALSSFDNHRFFAGLDGIATVRPV